MKAIIMAGGEGTRLRPLTSCLPKPMVPITNKPAMEYIIELLNDINIKDIAVTTYYLPSLISDYFGNGENLGVDLKYYIEETPLGTGGSVLNIDNFPKDTFIVISGDCVTDIDLAAAIRYHRSKNSKATLVLKSEPVPLEYGIVILDKAGRITRFLEKPNWGEVFSDTVNTGIYILEPEIFNYYRKGENFDFSKDLFPRLLKDNVPMYGYVANGYWCDVGDFNSYKQTQFDILNNKINLTKGLRQIKSGVWIGNDTVISKDVVIKPPVLIGKRCTIRPGVTLDSHTIIGDDCEIGENSTLKKSILWDHVTIGKNVQCRGTTICGKTIVKNNVNLYENTIIGSESILYSDVTVKPDIKIWPSKIISEGTVVNRNLIWGSKLSRITFSNNDITGEINTDITPEYASMLGSTFATVLKGAKPIVVSCDGTKQSLFIKNSIVSGMLSSGIRVISLDNIVTPISRFGVRFHKASGGIHVRSDSTENSLIHLELFNDKGGNINRKIQKNIEQLLLRGDFERCTPDKINNIMNIENFSSFYIQNNINSLKNLSETKGRGLKVLIASPSEMVSSIAKDYLTAIGCFASIDTSYQLNSSLENFSNCFSKKVSGNNIDMGVLINETGEKIILFDEKGTTIKDDKYLALTSLICLKGGISKKIILPVTATSAIENMAKKYDVEIVKSKSSSSEMMNEMLNNVNLENGDLIQYILNFDGILACGTLIDFMVNRSLTLSELLGEIPNFHIKRSEFKCDFESRGYIIRKLIEENENNNIELFEGVKINTFNGWSLILPDNDRPVFNIFTEGFTEEYAEELTDTINKKIQLLMDKK